MVNDCLTLYTSYFNNVSSKAEYRLFNIVTTSTGLLSELKEVNPTMSLKYMVTDSYDSGSTDSPPLSSSATLLKEDGK